MSARGLIQLNVEQAPCKAEGVRQRAPQFLQTLVLAKLDSTRPRTREHGCQSEAAKRAKRKKVFCRPHLWVKGCSLRFLISRLLHGSEDSLRPIRHGNCGQVGSGVRKQDGEIERGCVVLGIEVLATGL